MHSSPMAWGIDGGSELMRGGSEWNCFSAFVVYTRLLFL